MEPWGSWRVWARSAEYEALLEATCDAPGTPLRAPTPEAGLDVFCRDSFFGKARMRSKKPRRQIRPCRGEHCSGLS